MQRGILRGLALLTLGLAVMALRPARAADTPFKGTWKLIVTDRGQDITLALIRIEGADAAPTVTVAEAGSPLFRDAKVEEARGDASGVRFTLVGGGTPFRFAASRSRADAKVLFGSVQIRNQLQPITLERTTETEIDPRAV